MKTLRQTLLSASRVRDNVEIQVKDKNGKIKKVFQPWQIVMWAMEKGWISPLHAKIPGLFGYWSDSLSFSNGITNAGRAIISGLINGSGTPAAFTYIAVGTGSTAFSTADTTLGAESSTSGLSRAAGTVSRVTTAVTNDTAQVTITFSVSGSVAVTEAGLLNAASVGTLLCRQTFTAINVVNGDTLAVTWKVQNT